MAQRTEGGGGGLPRGKFLHVSNFHYFAHIAIVFGKDLFGTHTTGLRTHLWMFGWPALLLALGLPHRIQSLIVFLRLLFVLVIAQAFADFVEQTAFVWRVGSIFEQIWSGFWAWVGVGGSLGVEAGGHKGVACLKHGNNSNIEKMSHRIISPLRK